MGYYFISSNMAIKRKKQKRGGREKRRKLGKQGEEEEKKVEINKERQIIIVGKDVEKLEYSYTTCGIMKKGSHWKKAYPFFKKPNIELPYDPEVPLSNRYKNIYLQQAYI